MDILINHLWPGNIRELEHVIERALVIAETDELAREDLPLEITPGRNDAKKDWTLESMEREQILKVLHLTGGNKKKAAGLLGLDNSTLWRKLKRYRITG